MGYRFILFGRSCGLGGSAVSEIVNACAKRKLFDYELLEKYGILTSKGIQERFLEMTARRKANAIKQEYLLVKAEPCQNLVYADNNAVNVCNNPKNVCNNTQSKVKESNTTTTTTTNQSITPPSVTEVALYMRELGVGDSLVYGGDPFYEADKFVAYNAKRNWDSLPEWKKAADLWVSRIKERSRQ